MPLFGRLPHLRRPSTFPLASILALVNSNEQIDALRRAGCTHFLKKPITRKDLRVLTLRLAPVSRRFKDTDGVPQKTAPKPQAPSAKNSPRVSPDIPNLPELPGTGKAACPGPFHAPEQPRRRTGAC